MQISNMTEVAAKHYTAKGSS